MKMSIFWISFLMLNLLMMYMLLKSLFKVIDCNKTIKQLILFSKFFMDFLLMILFNYVCWKYSMNELLEFLMDNEGNNMMLMLMFLMMYLFLKK